MLQPLLTNDSMTEHLATIRGMMSQVDQYEFSRSLRTTNSSDGSAQSEVQRLIRRAFDQYSSGDPVQAVVQIEAISAMIDGDPRYSYLHRFLQESVRQWRTDQDIDSRRHILGQVHEVAEAAIGDDQVETARNKLQAALRIYANDNSVTEELLKCRQLLDSLPPVSESLQQDAPKQDTPAAEEIPATDSGKGPAPGDTPPALHPTSATDVDRKSADG